jgi:UDP-N-acetylmuramyl tripeptide synthase
MNVLAVVAVMEFNRDLEQLMEKVWNFQGVPWPLQRIPNVISSSIFVDYAHLEDVLINLLLALKSLTKNKLIVFFGWVEIGIGTKVQR